MILTASTQENTEKDAKKLKGKYTNAIIGGVSPDLTSLESVKEAFLRLNRNMDQLTYW